jgi:hypothetical protein
MPVGWDHTGAVEAVNALQILKDYGMNYAVYEFG